MMALQSLITSVVVSFCFVYAAWSLMPQAGRRTVSRALLRLPLPMQLTTSLQGMLRTPAGCDCAGCDKATVPLVRPVKLLTTASASTHVLRFHPRKLASTRDVPHVG